jgi:hypothetical protein
MKTAIALLLVLPLAACLSLKRHARLPVFIAILLVSYPHAMGSRIFCILKLGDECILSGLQAFGAENPVKLTRFNGLKGSTTNGGTLNPQERKQQ